MKRLFLALLSLSLFATCAIPASAQIPLENPDVTVISTVCPNPDCLNNEIPPRDGTGYQGGRNENSAQSSSSDISSAADADSTCPNPNCPNNGIPPRDGTGYQGGRNENSAQSSSSDISSAADADSTCPNPDCPNNGIPPRDGTGYQGGQKGYQNEQKQGKHYAKRTGNCQGNRAVCRYCA